MTQDVAKAVEERIRQQHKAFWVHLKRELEPATNLAISRSFQPQNEMQQVVFTFARKSLKSFSSVVILGSRGYGEDAILVTRSILEATVYAAALEEKPALARDFLDFYWIHEYRLLYDLKKLDPAYAAAIFDQRRAEEAERKFLEVAPRFKISPDRPHRGTWHKSSLPGLIHGLQRDEYKALWDLYLHGYRTGSDVAHGSVIDLMGRLEVKADGDIEQSAEPSERFVAQALITAHSSLLLMLVVCNHALGLSIEEMLQGLYEKHRALWPGDSAV